MRERTDGFDSGCCAFDLAFDEEKLMQEMNFFMTHFVGGLCKNKPAPSATALLEKFFCTSAGHSLQSHEYSRIETSIPAT